MGLDGRTLKIFQGVRREEKFDFSKHTTYGLGGSAGVAYYPENEKQTIAVFDYLSFNGKKFVTLGNGSNVLVSDNNFDGAVLMTKALTGLRRTGENTFFCQAGTTVSSLLKYCVSNGFGGLEYLAGIPATLGGLLFMNGGAGGKYIESNVVNVKFYDGKIHSFSNKNCRFGNKYSTMRDINCIILGAELRFTPQSDTVIKQKISEYLERRRFHPKGRSCGCIFKNVNGISAGKLIDDSGLKGFSIGGATVSCEHANFIISRGGSSSDVYLLINEVKRRVLEHTGIRLEEEVIYIGEFNDTFI
ncbi:MAG: UDP-N-acetylmuramate dehydrogenase [Clostridia bacterium]|nr:UDP-N-acetylmuramate dehydrogenase [Clostridia bacterium]